MKVNKEQLLKALEIVKPGLANKEKLEQSTSFAFINGRVATYNDSISVSHPVEGLEIEGAILAENLYKFLGKIKTEEIDLTLKGNEIILTSDKAKAGLLLQTEIKLPLDEEVSEKGKWHTLPENFLVALSFVMTACTRDMSRPVLTCVHINDKGFFEGSDGYRIARYELEQELPISTFLLPATSAIEVHKLNPIKVSEGNGWVHFKTESGTIISCRILQDKYPRTDSYFTQEGTKVVLPKTIEEILLRAMVFAKRDHLMDESIIVTVQDETITLAAKSDTAWFKEEAKIKYQGSVIKFDTVPYLLKGILSDTRVFYHTKDKLSFRGEKWQYVTPLRQIKE